MRRLAVISAVWLLALTPGLAVIDPPKKPEPAGASAPPSTVEPVLSAAEMTKSLAELVRIHSNTTDKLEKLVEEIGKLRAELAHLAKSPTNEDIFVLQGGLKRALQEMAETLGQMHGQFQQLGEKRAAADTAQLEKLAPEFEKMRALIAGLQAELDKLHKDIAARPLATVPSGTPSGDSAGLILALLAGGGLLLAGLILFTSAAQRRELRAVRPAAGHPVAAPDSGVLQREWQAAFAGWTRESAGRAEKIEAVVADLAAEIRALAARPVPTVLPVMMTPPEPSLSAPVPPPGAGPWPAPFLESGSPLAAWCRRLEAHFNSTEHPARPVHAALLALQAAAQRAAPQAPELAAGISALSSALHDYWLSLPGLTEDELLQANSDWIGGVKALTAGAAPKLDIRDITPGARFDPDSMQTVQEGPGNHLNVAQVFSWVVLDRSGERARILHRARIATT